MVAMSQTRNQSLPKFIELARYIAARADQTLTLERLARRVHLSPARMQRVFKSIFGVSPKKFQQAARSERFKALLRDGGDITTAIHEAGFGSSSRAYADTVNGMGMMPKRYRAGGAGETVTWACRETTLGKILMAATDRGVCFAQFGDDAEALLEQLRAEYPKAVLEAYDEVGSGELDRWIDALDAYMQQQRPRPDIPLDLRGTAFQIQVWEFLQQIEAGDTLSYSELASAIGKPRAVRAAASACAANRIAVLVPCHRILRADGGLGGYRWGASRKRRLLEAESHPGQAVSGL